MDWEYICLICLGRCCFITLLEKTMFGNLPNSWLACAHLLRLCASLRCKHKPVFASSKTFFPCTTASWSDFWHETHKYDVNEQDKHKTNSHIFWSSFLTNLIQYVIFNQRCTHKTPQNKNEINTKTRVELRDIFIVFVTSDSLV